MRFLHDRTDLGPKTGATPTAGSYSVWSCTLTTRNGLDISAAQWNTSPFNGASSAEFVGEFGFGEGTEVVIESGFVGFLGSEPV